MTTLKELIYAILDEIKLMSDDSYITEDHVRFFIKKYRSYILLQKYSNIKKQSPTSNYQTICLDLEEVPAIPGDCCFGVYLKSKEKIPALLDLGNPSVYPIDYYNSLITLVDKERMKYVGHNKYLQNIIYASIGPDNYLYLTSSNPQFLYLQKVKFTAIFEDVETASELMCDEEGIKCNTDELVFPMEDSLIALLIQSVVKDLLGLSWRPKDQQNNSSDDLSDISSFVRQNMKTQYQKQIEGDAT